MAPSPQQALSGQGVQKNVIFKRKAEDAKNEGALLTFLAKRPVTPSSETTQTEITAGNQSAVVSATASMDSESYPTELPESEPPAEGTKTLGYINSLYKLQQVLCYTHSQDKLQQVLNMIEKSK
ncbi:hypothetical protein HELRODRAFT_183154 [Helobdella robusta]|uniref:Uncharacterized protein n=1 Tax=Helobdella robusta TaxID=6412 RepID=T1FJ80_HELRO|nr:hypothetical protein HELRODRAFT_183154 [Helobdella robusta]ESO11460.1 hypothetical protein HELRODRAFT_183154 [Helobdella robusta]